jgi:hypothetical protein
MAPTNDYLAVFRPDSPERDRFLRGILYRKLISTPDKSKYLSGTVIKDIVIDNLSYDELSQLFFHFTAKENGASIEKDGLISGIGAISSRMDEKIGTYFTWGLEFLLHNLDVWARWQFCQLYNPGAPYYNIPQGIESCDSASQAATSNCTDFMKHVDKYFSNKKMREIVFWWLANFFRNCDYLVLDLIPGIDFDPEQEDPKKDCIDESYYTRRIYGAGISTDVTTMKAERWNMSTPLGKKFVLPPQKIRRAVLSNGRNTAQGILEFAYGRYMQHCKSENTEPAKFEMLADYFEFCKNH